MGKVFYEGLSEDDKRERLFKRLEYIENKNEDQSEKQLDAKPLKAIGFFNTLNDKAKKLVTDIKLLDDWLGNAQLVCTKTDGITKYDFSNFTFPSKFASKIYNKNLTLQKAEDNQQVLEILINNLNNDSNPRNPIKIKEREDALNSAKKLFIRENIIRAFKKGIFPYIDRFKVDEETDKEVDEEIDTTDMSDLENEESAAKKKRNQQGKGLKIINTKPNA